jgi:hypothetical protein
MAMLRTRISLSASQQPPTLKILLVHVRLFAYLSAVREEHRNCAWLSTCMYIVPTDTTS